MHRSNPETQLADRLKRFLEARGWTVLNTHGNAFQKGLPDKYCLHDKYKQRWIEVKNADRYHFTKAQLEVFPIIDRCRVGIWILTAATEEEYDKLFHEPNWKDYLKRGDWKWIQTKYDWFKN
jgi:hypothetical protein